MLRDFRISELCTLLNSVTPLIRRKKLISDASTWDRYLSVIIQDSWPLVRMGTKTVLKIECKACITALALPIRVSSFSSCFPSLVNATPRYLNFFTCFSVAPFTCNTHWSEFLERWSTSSFGRAYFHSGDVACICKAISCALEARFCGRKQSQIISE